jgi:RNA polymerase sigma-70 factor (ECF subfamily)
MIDDARSGHQEEVAQMESVYEPPLSGPAPAMRGTVAAEDGPRVRALVDRHFDFIWRALRRFGAGASDADDGAQRVFWIASQKLHEIEPGKDRAYLVGIAFRVAREIRRSNSRRPEGSIDGLDVEDAAPGPEELSDQRRARALLDRILDEMPLESRSVFVLFELEELSVPEIALLLEIPLGTVSSRLRRARDLFREAVAREQARAAFTGGVR